MYESIPFEVPAQWAAAVAAGTVKRFGVLLKDASTGKIVGFLQEAGGLSQSLGLDPLGALMGTTKAIASAGALLSGVGAIASIVGVGVSVLGFAQVKGRLAAIDQSLAAQDLRLTRLGARLNRTDFREAAREAAEVGVALAAAEEAWHRSDRVEYLRAHVDLRLRDAEMYWRTLLGAQGRSSMLLSSDFTLDEAMVAYGHVVQLSAVRVQVLMVEEELGAARSYATEIARWHADATRTLTAVDLAGARASDRGDATWRAARDRAEGAIRSIREADTLLDQRVHLLDTLEHLGVSPRAFVESARARDGVLVLPVAA